MIYSKHWSHLDVFHVVATVVVVVVRKSSKHENEKKSRINYVAAAAGDITGGLCQWVTVKIAIAKILSQTLAVCQFLFYFC